MVPNLSPFSFPPNAAEESASKAGTDFYGDLTDEERAAEDLPPREQPPAKEDAGDDKGETDPDEGQDEGEEEEDEPTGDSLTAKLFEDIGSLQEGLNSLLGRDEQPETRAEVDELMEAALEHEDPVVRGMAQELKEAKEALAEIKAAALEERDARQAAKDDADFDAVAKSYTISGAPLTDAHVRAVEEWIIANPEVGARLSIEQCTRLALPDAVKVDTKQPPSGRSKATGEGKVATVITEGSPGGAAEGPWKPRPNETIESAVAAGARLFGVKR